MEYHIQEIAKGVLHAIFVVVCVSFTRESTASARAWNGPEMLISDTPVRRPNNTVPGCWLGEQFYMAGDRWSPHIEPQGLMPCVKCQCAQVVKHGRIQVEGRVVCHNVKNECPEPNCSSPYLPPKSCCRICPGQETYFYDKAFDGDDVDTNIPIEPSHQDHRPKPTELTALLVGRGKKRSVRTRSVAMIHVTSSSSSTLKFALRFARLKEPLLLKLTDEYGTTLVEQRLPKQIYRTSVIYGEVHNIRQEFMDYIVSSNSYVTITTSRHRRGELSGRLNANSLASIATFEALLAPAQNKGTGALVTMFYDTSKHVASYTVQMAGLKTAQLDNTDYFVTFEKSTEIKYQHVLNVSPLKKQMVGQIEIDSRMSKQIARGKMHVRVTSRDGQTMIGVLKPRLLRTGLISLLPQHGSISGYVLLNLQEDGSIVYKTVTDRKDNVDIGILLQRQVNGKDQWDNFFSLGNFSALQNTNNKIPQTYKRIRSRDIVALLNGQLRLKLTQHRHSDFSYFQPYTESIDFLHEANHHLLRSEKVSCSGNVHMFTTIRPDCTLKYYLVSQATNYDPQEAFTMSLVSEVAGTVTKQIDKALPGFLPVLTSVHCKRLTGFPHETAVVDVDQKKYSWSNHHSDCKNCLAEPLGDINGLTNDLYRELGERGIVVQINIEDAVCDGFLGEVKIPNHCWGNGPNALSPENDRLNDPDTGHLKLFRCYYGGIFYEHAQSWLPDDGSSCVTCRCIRGNVLCDEVLCPSTTCRNPVLKSGECCAVCDDDNDTERKYLGSCYYDGDKRWHPVGTFWHPYVPPFGYSKCAICNCVSGSLEVNCTRLPCPDLTCPDHKRIRVNKDDCCQICRGSQNRLYNEDIDRIAISPVKAQSAKDCILGGQVFNHGDKWHPVLYPFGEMKCYICSCKNGKSKCRKQKCPILDCIHQYRPSGKCCPTCSGTSTDNS